MKIRLIAVSKGEDNHAHALFSQYSERLNHYVSFESLAIKPLKTFHPREQKKSDSNQVLKKIEPGDFVILLDERGKEMSSVNLANFISQHLNAGRKSLCFIIGGAYGYDKQIYDRSDASISISKMTLPHQLAKVIFAEQLYRAFTIIRNEKYHHGTDE